MRVLDAAAVARWHELATDRTVVEPHLRVELTAADEELLTRTRDSLRAALDGRAQPVAVDGTGAHRALCTFLAAFTAGVLEARLVEGTDPGQAGGLELVAGLLAGAQAMRTFSDQDGLDDPIGVLEKAGLAAADALATGSDVHEVLLAACSAFAGRWRPTAVAESARLFGLLARVLFALSGAGAPMRPERAECGAAPGEHRGTRFTAEITFAVIVPNDVALALQRELRQHAQDVTLWSTADQHRFHVHSTDPAGVINLAFATATVFDLQIGQLPGD